jgi:thioredoxin 2
MVSPALERIAAEYAGRVKLVKLNVDQTPRLSDRFAVRAVPTLLLMRGDGVLARQAGVAPLPALRAWVDRGLAGTATAPPPSG